jgi:hypothetical protein
MIELEKVLVLLKKGLFDRLTEWAEMDKAEEQTTMLCCGKKSGFVVNTDAEEK